jgi:dienelactone hydrolase
MVGNVWEWCQDRHSAVPVVDRIADPLGPGTGPDRVIRGGSFLSTSSNWNKGLRSSLPPEAHSRYTGFRVVRSGEVKSDVRPLVRPAAKAGDSALRAQWLEVLGAPKVPAPAPSARLVETVEDPIYTGQLLDLQTEPDSWERIFVMRPRGVARTPRPVIIVPFYDVDTPAGRNLGGRRFVPPSVRSFAYVAVQRGYVAIAIRWFGESYGEGYDEAVANLARRHPGCTGLGKWIWDSQRLLDYIETLPGVDATRIGMIGHSLGGKMALYAAAFDNRIGVIVSSEPGIGLKLSNYDDFWYLGERIRKLPEGADQHQLLTLIAPRPFLLIAGEDSDGDKSLPILDAARPAYEAAGAAAKLGFFNHRTGHSPTAESVVAAMAWLDATLR